MAKRAVKKVGKKPAKKAAKTAKKSAAKKSAAKRAARPSITGLHPMIDKGTFARAKKGFAGGDLQCNCATDPVVVHIEGQSLHNHACGCSKCWKPEGAIFSIVAVAPSDKVTVTANGDKLHIVDESALILRHACRDCGAHMHGPVKREGHAFTGLTFIHTELSKDAGWSPPGFAAFVSSVIETGTDPELMPKIRQRLRQVGLEPYDALSPGLMDYLATHTAKQKGTYKSK